MSKNYFDTIDALFETNPAAARTLDNAVDAYIGVMEIHDNGVATLHRTAQNRFELNLLEGTNPEYTALRYYSSREAVSRQIEELLLESGWQWVGGDYQYSSGWLQYDGIELCVTNELD